MHNCAANAKTGLRLKSEARFYSIIHHRFWAAQCAVLVLVSELVAALVCCLCLALALLAY